MRNKNILFFAIFLSVLFLFGFSANACKPIDWMYASNIGNMNVDTQLLEKKCTEEACSITDDFIAIRSHFNSDVLLIISKNSSYFGFNSVTTRLPYGLTKLGMMLSEWQYQDYPWGESIEIDLGYLKTIGVLGIDDAEIGEISRLASYGKNILYCQGQWQSFGAGCTCKDEVELCADCDGKEAIAASLPNELMPWTFEEEKQEEPEQSSEEISEVGELPEEKQAVSEPQKNKDEFGQKYLYALLLIIATFIAVFPVIRKKIKTSRYLTK